MSERPVSSGAGPTVAARRGHLAMLAFSALVAGSFSLGAMAAPHVAPEAFTAMRFTIAALGVALVMRAAGPVPRAALTAPWRYILLAGLFAGYFVTMFTGLQTAPAVSMSTVFTLTPAMSALFGWWLLGQRTTPRMALALLIGGTGALWVVFRGDLSALLALEVGRGEAIFFVGCVAHAVYTPLLARLNRGEPALVVNTAVLGTGAILLWIWGWRAMVGTDWAALPQIVWTTLLYTAIAATALTFALVRFSALRLPSAKVMAYTYLVPSWVLVWDMALGRSLPEARVLAGGALTIVALALLLRDDG
ncbi:EamA-like transporter family protein [Roseivivax jejudonensis]|uniref:EamA-like transporter family protein n=1 Tax=Roseivivax jejudonensis TaxID=1529041 RepID=A0A1X7A2V0_9RHOB|nr:DMT family transporter [Roseivivax jejudonensis]SLN67120.1 EamA-like transporter family protein [Roseivivax jejudonensis]